MSKITKEQLKKEITEILKGADLTVFTEKKVREELEKKFKCDLTSRKNEIKTIVMDYIENEADDDEEDGEEEESEDEDKNGQDSGSGEEYSPKKSVAKNNKKKAAEESESGSDEEWKKPPPAKKGKKAAGAGAGGKAKGTGFTRPLTLSPQLAELMGAEQLPRHEVVKKIWAIIKERNLYDPKNKQFAICDNDLSKVFNVKRFRTFGMLKYLRPHFID